MRRVSFSAVALASAVSCGIPKEPPKVSATGPAAESVLPPKGSAASTNAPAIEAVPASPNTMGPAAVGERLTVTEARQYMVTLINRDRATMGLAAVELDPGSPTEAGQAHADDMASHGYLGHWGTDGSVPEQRLTEAGGSDMVLENALCFIDETARKLDAAPTIDRAEIDRAEDLFFNEKPPNDGHRKNILKPAHRRVGIGVAQPVRTKTEIPVPCFTQEFTDPYGTYAAVPRTLKVGARLHVEGDVQAPATVGGVGLARVASPRSITVAEANKRRSYPVPSPYVVYWPTGFKTPIPLAVKGSHFSIDIPVTNHGEPGLYELSIFGKLPGSPEFVMLGLRTIYVTH